MKNISLIILFVLSFLSFCSTAQDLKKRIVNQEVYYEYPFPVNEMGIAPSLDSLPDGKYLGFQLIMKKYIDGRPQQVDPYLDTNNVRAIFEIKEGVKNGRCLVFSIDGEKLAAGQFKDDLQSGTWEYFRNGQLRGTASFDEGVLNGEWLSYSKKGGLLTRGNYENGRATGTWKDYYESGSLKEEYSFVNCYSPSNDTLIDKVYRDERIQRTYHNYISRKNTFSNFPYARTEELGACQHGEHKFYDKKGNLILTNHYQLGDIIEDKSFDISDTNYHKNGKIASFMSFVDPNYEVQYFSEKGVKKGKAVMNRDLEVWKVVRWDDKQRLTDSLIIDTVSNNQVYNYFSNGKMVKEYRLDTSVNEVIYHEFTLSKQDTLMKLVFNERGDSGRMVIRTKKYDVQLKLHPDVDFGEYLFTKDGKPFSGSIVIDEDVFSQYYHELRINYDELLGSNQAGKYAHVWKGKCENGKMQGVWKGYSYKGGLVASFSFSKGLPHGTFEYYTYHRDKGVFKRKKQVVQISMNYNMGKVDGWKNIYYSNGQLKHKALYANDSATGDINGYYSDGVPSYEVRQKDSLYEYRSLNYGFVGAISEFTSQEALNFLAKKNRYVFYNHYKNGWFYNFDNAGNIQKDGKYKNGCRVGEWTDWYDTGMKKHVCLYPDSSVTRFYSDWGEDDGHHTYYYNSGNISHYGKVENGRRLGEWLFYNELDSLIKRIQYGKDTLVFEGVKDTLYVVHFGFYESWYDNGQKMTEGYILDENSDFDCDQESYLKLQDMFVINQWKENGEQVLKRGNGNYYTYHANGQWASHGQMVDGLENGEWLYWTPDARLTEKGRFKNGRKVGRWLSGDLEGTSYINRACYRPEGFSSDQEYEEHLSSMSKKLKIQERFYHKGKLVNELGYLSYCFD